MGSLLLANLPDARETIRSAAPGAATGGASQPMGGGQPAAAPGLELTLRRITLAPGGRVPAHSHPGAPVIFVEAGTGATRRSAGPRR